jgi:HEAT repeat protein
MEGRFPSGMEASGIHREKRTQKGGNMRRGFSLFMSCLLFCLVRCILLIAPLAYADNDTIPIENWERDEKIDSDVLKMTDELEQICEKFKDTPQEIAWNEEAAKLMFKLRNMGKAAIPALYDVAKDKQRDGNLRKIAISRMAFTRVPAVTEPLIRFLRDRDEQLNIRLNAADLLGRILKDTTATPFMIEVMMDEENAEVLRSKVASGFVSIHDKRVVRHLVKLAKEDGSSDMRAMAAWGLGANAHFLKDTSVTRPLLQMLDEEKNDIVRMKLIGALGVTDDERVVPPLLNLLNEKGPNYDDAIKALGNPLYQRAAKEPLMEIFKSKDDPFRIIAAEALIKHGDSLTVQEIEEELPALPEKDAARIRKKLEAFERGGGSQ